MVTSKTVYLCHLLSYRKSTKEKQKTPISRRENGALESGIDETRTRDLRLDRTEVSRRVDDLCVHHLCVHFAHFGPFLV